MTDTASRTATKGRELFEPEHEEFREMVRTFIDKEIRPFHNQWESDGVVSRDVWLAAGRQGLLGMEVPEEYGGGGVPDFRYNVVVHEELARAGTLGVALPLHNDLVAPYLLRLATDEQKARWLPGFCSGEIITAIAMTEPEAGSDLQGIRTQAIDHGDHYLLNGQKTFITNASLADLIIVVARTDPDAGARGMSLLVVERGMPGFERGRRLEKVGLKAQDTGELFFSDVRVPRDNVLGVLGGGFGHLMENLAQERLSIAVGAVATAEAIFESTTEYCGARKAFGRTLSKFQNTRFVLAELATEIAITRCFVDRCISQLEDNQLDGVTAAMAKWWSTELQQRVVDRCLQLHGGYGYMLEYPVARAYQDSRIQTIYGGTTEIMKEIIGRSIVG